MRVHNIFRTKISKSGLDKFSLQGTESQVDKRWKKWFEAFEHYVDAEGLTDADRKLHTVGMDVQEIYNDLTDQAATAPAYDDAYKMALRKLNAYFSITNPILHLKDAFSDK